MPRKRKETYSGTPAQRVSSVPGQRYGEAQQTQQLQQALPAPDNRYALQEAAMQGVVPPGTPPPPVGTGPDMEQIAQLMQSDPNFQTGGFYAPTARPNEPTTTGLPIGLGAGPEVMMTRGATSPVGQWFRQLSAVMGDDYWRELAERAGL